MDDDQDDCLAKIRRRHGITTAWRDSAHTLQELGPSLL